MSLLFESIRTEGGILHNLAYHNQRMNEAREVHFGSRDMINLEQLVQIPSTCKTGLFKCRVSYSRDIENIEFERYIPRSIKSLRLIESDTTSYTYKYTNRDLLNELFAKRGQYDDILIIKKGFVTDTSFSNIIFSDGIQWYTPSDPLLKGTMRNFLLGNKLVTEMKIKVPDLCYFQKARLINAMVPIEACTDIRISDIGY